MTAKPRIGLWFAGTSAIFFTRAFLFSTWVSRGPEVQEALGINTAQMGLLSMLFPAGGLAGILFANSLVHRYGSKLINPATFVLVSVGFIALGPVVESGNFFVACICLFVMGLPMSISDYIGNLEASGVNAASKRALFPAIHGLFGVGMLLGASVASFLIEQNISLSTSFIAVAIFVGVVSVLAGFTFPKHVEPEITAEAKAINRKLAMKVWTEKRSLLLAVVGISFIIAETSAGTWVPIALTKSGFSGAEAASAFGVFWIVITFARLFGGYVVDFVGRFATVLISSLTTAIGMFIFITTGLPYVGLILWGLGMALGFPMVVSSMSDDAKLAAPRVNMIITVVYIGSISVGPALGALGQAAGIYVAFAIPLAIMLIAASLSKITKPSTAK